MAALTTMPEGDGAAGRQQGLAFVPRRGRPSAAQAEAIDRAILSVATRQFLSLGFDGATMEAIAVQARVAKGTLYARYPTKEAMLHAVMADRVRAWSDETRPFDDLLPGDLTERLRIHARVVMRWLGRDEIRAFEQLLRGPAIPIEVRRDFYETGHCFLIRFLADEIMRGTADDAAPARDPERVSELLLAMLYGWRRVESDIRDIPDAEAEAHADRAVDILVAGRQAW